MFYSLYQQNSEVVITKNGDLVDNVAEHFVQKSMSLLPCDLKDVAYLLSVFF